MGILDRIKKAASSGEDHLKILIWGSNGCLRGDVPVYDPVTKETISIGERWSKHVGFHVYAMSPSGVVISAAAPPVKYQVTPMLEVALQDGRSIVVTPNHRLWNGEEWVTASACYERLQECGHVLLATSEDGDLSVHATDGYHWKKTDEGFPDGCLIGHHYDDAQLPSGQGSDGVCLPSQDGALERSQKQLQMDGLELSQEHSQICQSPGHHSRNNSAPSVLHDLESSHQVTESPSLHDDKKIPIHQQSLADSDLADIAPEPSAFVPRSMFFCPSDNSSIEGVHIKDTPSPHGWLALSEVRSIEQVGAEPYFDFHVPVYGNYWANGMWHHNSGKSTLCGTAPKPILYAYTERQGLLSFQRMCPDGDVVKIETVADLRELLIALRDGQHGYSSVCLDSFTEMQLLISDELLSRRKIKNEEKGKDSAGEPPKLVMEDYGFIHDRSKSLVRAFRDLPMHVILTCLSETSEVGEGAEAKTVTKMMLMGRKLPAQLGQFFNLVGFSYRAQKDQESIYRVLFEGRSDIDTKGMPGLRKREDPDIAYWVARAINGCPPRDSDAPMIAMPRQTQPGKAIEKAEDTEYQQHAEKTGGKKKEK